MSEYETDGQFQDHGHNLESETLEEKDHQSLDNQVNQYFKDIRYTTQEYDDDDLDDDDDDDDDDEVPVTVAVKIMKMMRTKIAMRMTLMTKENYLRNTIVPTITVMVTILIPILEDLINTTLSNIIMLPSPGSTLKKTKLLIMPE